LRCLLFLDKFANSSALPSKAFASAVLETLIEVDRQPHIALTLHGKTLNKINIEHCSPPSLKLRRASCFA
jgi:hypothetical protein